jgi:hypothetical protein
VPDFIGLGAPKCATTWIAQCLFETEGIFMSSPKEIHYFTSNFDKTVAWYESHFPNTPAKYHASGEFSTCYLSSPKAILRIKHYYPYARLLVSVRNPLDRLISEICHQARLGRIMIPDSMELTPSFYNENIEKLKPLIANSLYSEHLSFLYSHFHSDQILVIDVANISKNPGNIYLQIISHIAPTLEVKTIPQSVTSTISQSFLPSYPSIGKAHQFTYRALKRIPYLVPLVRKSAIVKSIKSTLSLKSKPYFSPALANSLDALLGPDWAKTKQYFALDT